MIERVFEFMAHGKYCEESSQCKEWGEGLSNWQDLDVSHCHCPSYLI